MIITISGLPGSGKSTIGKLLAQKLGYRFYSMGDLRGKMAMDRGMNIDALNKVGEQEPWTDRDVDDYQKKLGETEDNFVIDGRLSWFFIPRSLKIFLTVKLEEGAERIFQRQRPDETPAASAQDVLNTLKTRITSDGVRYQKWYHVRFDDPANYDVTIDTTTLAPEAVVKKIMDNLPAS